MPPISKNLFLEDAFNAKPKVWHSMTRADKINLLTDWVDGKAIEYLVADGEWTEAVKNTPYPVWRDDVAYRVRIIRPSIDWSHVGLVYQYLAQDRDGAFLFQNRPNFNAESKTWRRAGGEAVDANVFHSLVLGDCEPEDSLVERY